ncbi:hypothetical protein SK128_001055, partial [Halocaridina rubra]
MSKQLGDEVWVKLPDWKFTSQWRRVTVMDVHSKDNVFANGKQGHILDLLRVVDSGESEAKEDKDLSLLRSQQEGR